MHQLVRIMWRFSLAFIFFELPTFLKLLFKSILKEAARKTCSQIMLWITFLSLIRSWLGQIWVPLLRFSCKSMFSCKPEKAKIHFFEGHLRVAVRSLFFQFFLGLAPVHYFLHYGSAHFLFHISCNPAKRICFT